jgi:hypothetical protein
MEQILVQRLMREAESCAEQIEAPAQPLTEFGADEATHLRAHVVSTAVSLLGAALIRTCRVHTTDPLDALDTVIQGLQQARALMARRKAARS